MVECWLRYDEVDVDVLDRCWLLSNYFLNGMVRIVLNKDEHGYSVNVRVGICTAIRFDITNPITKYGKWQSSCSCSYYHKDQPKFSNDRLNNNRYFCYENTVEIMFHFICYPSVS